MIAIAMKMGLKITAEGVASSEQLKFLKKENFDEAQGFHICRPMTANDAENFLRLFNRLDGAEEEM